jgi:hypothetical protein
MALSQQAILRAARLESGLFTTSLNETLDTNDRPFTPMSKELAGDGDIEITRTQNRNYCLADGFLRLVRQSNGWSIFLRYQAQAERQYRRALEDVDRLKALRHDLPNEELPNEPISSLQPQHESTTYPTPETNPSPPENALSAAPDAAVPQPTSGADPLVRARRPRRPVRGWRSKPRGGKLCCSYSLQPSSSIARENSFIANQWHSTS